VSENAARRSIAEARNDSLSRYLREIGKYPLVDREEEESLGRRIRAGDGEALNHLVCANLRFVVLIAKRYRNQGVGFADLINEGNVGLLRAASKFDETKGVRFISYAVWWVRQSMVQAIADHGHVVRVPTSRAGMAFRAATPIVSLDAPVSEDGDISLSEYIFNEDSSGADDAVEDDGLMRSVRDALGGLRGREADVIRLYFGFGGRDPVTLEAIGEMYGITRERVRQIKDRALARLRKADTRGVLASFGAPE
jgi:RNA polymerase primary sigma factor